ncbi:hypothetical protein N656DRAFT_775918 [Canariomyces notabilis]|uniref:Uncharacterized protein n=1 Tax=Canariomyces notabilis TaxID=2074819 RepID=A0AAN6YVU0_9PEZI|nr:hypothetical protein N656DRAFT_775918 [Canariomyces arenarius]
MTRVTRHSSSSLWLSVAGPCVEAVSTRFAGCLDTAHLGLNCAYQSSEQACYDILCPTGHWIDTLPETRSAEIESFLNTQCPSTSVNGQPPWTSYCPEGVRTYPGAVYHTATVTAGGYAVTAEPTRIESNREPNQRPNPNGASRKDGLQVGLAAAIAVVLLGMAM